MVFSIRKKTMIVLANQSEGLRMKDAFEQIGIDACAVDNGFAAKNLAAKEFFDIIICDAVLPDLTGRELLEEMMIISPESRILLIERPSTEVSPIDELLNSELFNTLFSQGGAFKKVYPSN